MAHGAQAQNRLAFAACDTSIGTVGRPPPTSTSTSPLNHPSGATGSAPQRDAWLGWLLAILALGMVLRLWVWHGHAVDSDEGAHLMDARFALSGLVPYVDFQPRGIVYTYVLAAFVWLVGPDYSLVRLCVLGVELLVCGLLYVIGRRLFNDRVALLAAATYMFYPLTVRSAPIVHMQPFAVLTACGVAYLLIRHLEADARWGTLLAAGMLIAVGIHVRESGVAIGLSAALTLAVWTWKRPGLLLRRYAVLGAGFVIACTAVSLPYIGRVSANRWWQTPLNPLRVFVRHLQPVSLPGADSLALWGLAPNPVAGTFVRHAQTWVDTWQSLQDTIIALAPLLVALAVSVVLVITADRESPRSSGLRLAAAVLYPWFAAFALAYGYWTVYRGFFAEYAMEVVPPLAIIFGFVLLELTRRWESGRLLGWAILLLTGYALAVYLGSPPGPSPVPRYLYLAIPLLALAPPWIAWKRGDRWWPMVVVLGLAVLVVPMPLGLPYAVRSGLRAVAMVGLIVGGWLAARKQQMAARSRPSLLTYATLVVLGATSGISLDMTVHAKGLRFGGVWSAASVREIADLLRHRGQDGDEVISGAVIWELQAGRQPFARVTHPLKFEFGIELREFDRLTERLRTTPPRFVVFDGYTERTYARVLPVLAEVVRDRYEPIATTSAGYYQVRLYQLRGEAAASP